MKDKKQAISLDYLILLSFLFFLFSPNKSIGQVTPTNLEILYKLADSAAYNLADQIPVSQKKIKLNFVVGNSYKIFADKIITTLTNDGIKILSENSKDSSLIIVNFTIDNAKVLYGALFKKSFLGDFYTTRDFIFSGSYILNSSDVKPSNFNFSYTDTVASSDIKNLENPSYPFTQAQLPAEPFISSIYEPVIAVGAAALTVILFFTVRSK